jgi:hypothetical protein
MLSSTVQFYRISLVLIFTAISAHQLLADSKIRPFDPTVRVLLVHCPETATVRVNGQSTFTRGTVRQYALRYVVGTPCRVEIQERRNTEFVSTAKEFTIDSRVATYVVRFDETTSSAAYSPGSSQSTPRQNRNVDESNLINQALSEARSRVAAIQQARDRAASEERSAKLELAKYAAIVQQKATATAELENVKKALRDAVSNELAIKLALADGEETEKNAATDLNDLRIKLGPEQNASERNVLKKKINDVEKFRRLHEAGNARLRQQASLRQADRERAETLYQKLEQAAATVELARATAVERKSVLQLTETVSRAAKEGADTQLGEATTHLRNLRLNLLNVLQWEVRAQPVGSPVSTKIRDAPPKT